MTASVLIHHLPARTGPLQHASIAHLASAMRDEERLILDLVGVIRAQRNAVAHDDLGGVDDSVFATHRMLVTLREAQQRRQNLAVVLCDGAPVTIHELEHHLGPRMTGSLGAARDALHGAAALLANEVAQNRRVLQSAMATNERQMRVVAGAPPAADPWRTNVPGGSGGALFDRRG